MADSTYVRLLPTFWNDPKVKRKLAREQKHVLLYLMSSPHINLIGLYYLPLYVAQAEVDYTAAEVETMLRGPLAPFASYDWDTEEILVHRSARHQIGEQLKPGDKRIKAVLRVLAGTHSADLVQRFVQLYSDWPLGDKYAGLTKPLDKDLGKPHEEPHTKPYPLSVDLACTERDVRKASDKSDEDEPRKSHSRSKPKGDQQPTAAGTDANALLAPLIREHLWLGPNAPKLRSQPGWNMGRELNLAAQLITKTGITAEEMAGAIECARTVFDFPDDQPLTLLIFNVEGQLGRLHECVGVWQKREARNRAQRTGGLERASVHIG